MNQKIQQALETNNQKDAEIQQLNKLIKNLKKQELIPTFFDSLQNIEKEKAIGEGGFSIVYKVTITMKQTYALKVMKTQKGREIEDLRK